MCNAIAFKQRLNKQRFQNATAFKQRLNKQRFRNATAFKQRYLHITCIYTACLRTPKRLRNAKYEQRVRTATTFKQRYFERVSCLGVWFVFQAFAY